MSDEVNESKEEVAPAKQVIATFTSHPVQNFRVGNFQFAKGVLKFHEGEEESLEKFQKFIDTLPPIERRRIQVIDVEAAEALIKKLREESGGATQQTDSTVGDRATKPKPIGNLGTTSGLGNR